jgi:two-component system, OmpR family, sensor histidine kinase CiaH
MSDPTAQLLGATRRRLIAVTLGLVAALVLGIGAATAFVALRALDADVDRALAASVDSAVARLDGEPPQVQESSESDETAPAVADTFLFYLDPTGNEVLNPSRVTLTGLPDEAAVAKTTRRDLRTVDAGGVAVRLLTVPIGPSPGGAPAGFVQGGFVLTLHDEQAGSLLTAIALVAGAGLLGAALVTLVVTGDALVPVRRSIAAQRRFVADASHELKTPTAIIRSNAEVLQREALVADKGRPFVSDIVTESDRLARLVGDLLQLASADAGGMVIERRSVDLAAVAAETVRQAQALASEHDVGLEFETAGDAWSPMTIAGDADRLTQLVLILVDNALDHSPPATTVRVGVRRGDGHVELSVADEGPGIRADERDLIFEPFARLPGVRRDGADGTGLGLAIARRIALAHDGTITVDASGRSGARFVAAFPAVAADRHPGPRPVS